MLISISTMFIPLLFVILLIASFLNSAAIKVTNKGHSDEAKLEKTQFNTYQLNREQHKGY